LNASGRGHRSADDAGECVQGCDGVFPAGGEEAAKALLGGAGPGSIATEDLTAPHGRTYRLLGWPVGGFDVSVVKEGEDLPAMFFQVIVESAIVLVRTRACQQFIQPLFE